MSVRLVLEEKLFSLLQARKLSRTPASSAPRIPTEPAFNNVIVGQKAAIEQIKFLLECAPMIEAPSGSDAGSRYAASRSKFAYVHPKTIASTTFSGKTLSSPFLKFPRTPTIYVITSLMPEGRIIYSNKPLPGYENRISEFIDQMAAPLNRRRRAGL